MKIYHFILIGIVLLILGIWLGRDLTYRFTLNEADEFPSATVLQVPIPIFQISLTDHNGQNFRVRRLARKWTFMFFGYTHCPDVCPMALVDLNAVFNNLTEEGDLIFEKYNVDTQFIFVSVDPQRDTVGELKEYISYFNKNFIALTAEPDMIEKLAQPLGVSYMRMPGKDSEGDYYIDHSASFLLIDPLGRLRAYFPPPHNPEQVAEDFRRIRKKYTEECCRTNITFEYIKLGDEDEDEDEYEEDKEGNR
jgi:protein SCO1/2